MTDGTESQAYRIADANCYVKIRYTVKVENGRVLKGAGEPEVMDFVTGFRQVVPGLEQRLIGHCLGERLAFVVPAEEAFGPRHQELVIEKSKKDFHFPAGMQPCVGMELPMISSNDNAPDTVRIKEVREDTIVIDCNHPLSGVALDYKLEIVEARPAGPSDVCAEWEEQKSEHDHSCCGAPHQLVLGGEEPGNA